VGVKERAARNEKDRTQPRRNESPKKKGVKKRWGKVPPSEDLWDEIKGVKVLCQWC